MTFESDLNIIQKSVKEIYYHKGGACYCEMFVYIGYQHNTLLGQYLEYYEKMLKYSDESEKHNFTFELHGVSEVKENKSSLE